MTALDTLVKAAEAPAPELPRMTCAQVFSHHSRMGSFLELTVDAFKKVPACPPDAVSDHLKTIIKQCEAIIKLANRMLEANR